MWPLAPRWRTSAAGRCRSSTPAVEWCASIRRSVNGWASSTSATWARRASRGQARRRSSTPVCPTTWVASPRARRSTPCAVTRLQAAAPAGLQITNLHQGYGVIAVQGARSDDVLEGLGLPTGHEYMSFVQADWNGKPVIVCRTGYTGERGYELVPLWDDALALWDALIEAAAPYEGLPCGLGARDTLRTEMGYPLHGHDLSLDITPVQARAGWAVGWKKDAFWGKDALVAEKAACLKRVTWGLLATGCGIPRGHCQVK